VAAAAAAIPVEVEAVIPGVAVVAADIPAAAEAEYRRATARHLLRATEHHPAAVAGAVSAGVVVSGAAGHPRPATELRLAPPVVTGHPRARLPPTERLPVEAAVSAAGVVSAAVNPRRLMVHPRAEAADPRRRTVHLPAAAAVVVSEAASEVERLRRAMEPLPRVTVHPLRATGHRAAVAEVEADRRPAMERLVLAAVVDILVVAEVSAGVDSLADQCPLRMAHHREVAAVDIPVEAAAVDIPVEAAAVDIPVAAAAVDIPVAAAAVDIPAVAAEDIPVAAAAVDIPAGAAAEDIPAVVEADIPAAVVVAGKINLIPIIKRDVSR